MLIYALFYVFITEKCLKSRNTPPPNVWYVMKKYLILYPIINLSIISCIVHGLVGGLFVPDQL